MKSIQKIVLMLIFTSTVATLVYAAPIKNQTTIAVKIYGNCDQCKAAIENAGKLKNISKLDWNKDSKIAMIIYDAKKITKDAILKKIALAGYDSDIFLAPDAAYNKLSACCKYERVNKPLVKETAASTGKDIFSTASNTANDLQAVFDAYFLLKDALVKTDGSMASEKAKDLQMAIDAVNMDKLSMDVHMVWMKILNALKEDATHINGTKDIELQRNHFITLSKNIYTLIKVSKPAETVYYQHCPMANDGKGADWLSKENAVKNPYYGAAMLTCGKIVETIK